MIKSVDEFYLNQSEPNRSCLLHLRKIILAYDELLREETKYGMPCFCFNDKPVCYLWIDKNTTEPYILWVDGNQITHPKLEVGSRKRMKILRINPALDIPRKTICKILSTALNLKRVKL